MNRFVTKGLMAAAVAFAIALLLAGLASDRLAPQFGVATLMIVLVVAGLCGFFFVGAAGLKRLFHWERHPHLPARHH